MTGQEIALKEAYDRAALALTHMVAAARLLGENFEGESMNRASCWRPFSTTPRRRGKGWTCCHPTVPAMTEPRDPLKEAERLQTIAEELHRLADEATERLRAALARAERRG